MKALKIHIFGFLLTVAAVISSCTTEAYDSGDDEYSYLRSDFAMVNTNSQSQFVSFITDEDCGFTLSRAVTVADAKPDTVYRALVTYDFNGTSNVKLRGFTSVGVLTPHQLKADEKMITDPLGFQSAWISSNGKYLNLTVVVKKGESEKKQSVGIVRDDADKNVLTLYHDQNGVPEYYSQKTYLSIPLDGFAKGDTITLNINTYEGLLAKTFLLQ